MAAQLKQWIEEWAAELRRTRLSKVAQHDSLPPRAVGRYLESLRYLFLNSQQSLVIAARESRRIGREDLAAYFARKASEEHGHDAWAENDLARLPAATLAALHPADAIRELVQLQRALIAEHPLCFAAYALWAEYLTVLTGDEWLAVLSDRGYGRGQMSAVAKHVDADRAHVVQAFEELDRLWAGEPGLPILLESIGQAGRIFCKFCDELMRELPPLAAGDDQARVRPSTKMAHAIMT